MHQNNIQYISSEELPYYMQEYAPTIFDEFAIVAYIERGWFSENQVYVCLVPNTEGDLDLFRSRLDKVLPDASRELRHYCICIPGQGGWFTGWKDWCRSSQIYSITVDMTEEHYAIEFCHSESFGNYEYAGGYRECKYSICIEKEYFKDPTHRQISQFVSSDVTILQERNPH